jgi:ATP-dependent Clp protease ATP-binding subunit ClpC
MGAIANENLKWSKQMTQLVHPDVVNLMREAMRYAQFKEKTLTPELMFAAMLKNPDPVVREFLRRWSVNVAIFEVRDVPPEFEVVDPEIQCSANVPLAMGYAREESEGKEIRVAHVLMGILRTDCAITEYLAQKYWLKWNLRVKLMLRALQEEADATRTDQPPGTTGVHTAEESETPMNHEPEQTSEPNKSDEGASPAETSQGKALVVTRKPRPRLRSDSVLLANGGIDLTLLAEEGKLEPYIGGDAKIDFTIAVLGRKIKGNPCITGGAGVGKTSMVEALAQRIADGTVPPLLQNAIIVSMNFTDIVSGTKYRGEFEEKMKQIIKELRDNPNYILFVDEVHTMVGAGETSGGKLDGANILKAALADKVQPIRCIGATTAKEYRAHIKKDKALSRRFEEVALEEPSAEDAELIMVGARLTLEKWHKANILNEALRRAVELSFQYLKPRGDAVVDSAKSLLDTACSALKCAQFGGDPERLATSRELDRLALQIQMAERDSESSTLERLKARLAHLQAKMAALPQPTASADEGITVTAAAINDAFTLSKNIKLKPEAERLSGLLNAIRSMVIGQSEPINSVVNAIQVASAFKEPNKPIGSFLFLGPTGVGKTEVARALAFGLFDDPDALIRIDMSEYMEKHTVSRLIGAPPGYVGFEQEGALTEPVNRRPYCVLLLDEIEKAHPDVWNILLQVMDHGKLTDAQGNTIDFSHVLLIMTANVGSEQLTPEAMFDVTETKADKKSISTNNSLMKKRVIKAANAFFRPEWLNRLTEVCVYLHLTEEEIGEVTPMKVKQLVKLVADKVDLDVRPDVHQFLCEKGFSRAFGARQLLRTIYKYIKVPLAPRVNSGEFKHGDTVEAYMDKTGKKVEFRKKD